MATGRGGKRPGAGRKKKPLSEKILEGNTGHRSLKVIELPHSGDGEVAEMSTPDKFLSAVQKDGKKTQAEAIYTRTFEWIKERGCVHLIPQYMIERFAWHAARWQQAEEFINQEGFTAPHPTTKGVMKSPYIDISMQYSNKTDQIWSYIWQIIADNCTKTIPTGGKKDSMERLLGGD